MKSWADGAYYSSKAERERLFENFRHQSLLRDRIMEKFPNCDEVVQSTVHKWHRQVRNRLRDEMGLRLQSSQGMERVAIEVADGLPGPIVHVLEHFDPKLLILLFNKDRISEANQTLSWILAVESELPDETLPLPQNSFNETKGWFGSAEELIKGLPDELSVQLCNLDCLGAYWFYKSRITIHWMAIGLSAINSGLGIEQLTLLTLFHELAHAYHHRAYDIDGRQFDTFGFGNSEKGFIEGVAQYYTKKLINSDIGQINHLITAWDWHQSVCPKEYVVPSKWLEGTREKEVMRSAMISAREGVVSLSGFDLARESAKGTLGHG